MVLFSGVHLLLAWRRSLIMFGLGAAFFGSPAAQAEKVRLAYSQTLYSAHVIVALEKNMFKQHGIDLEPEIFASGKLTLDAVMAGAADLSTTAESPITAAVMSDRPIAILCRLIETTQTTLVSASAGINKLEDLKGKRIAITAGSGSEVYAYSLLRSVGLKPTDVTLINLRPEDMPASLANGSVDAINTYQPYISYAQRIMGDKAKLLDTKGIYTETFNLIAMQSYAKKNSDAIKRTLQALLEAEKFIHANKKETIDILSRVVGVDRNSVEQSWSNFEYRIALDPALLKVLNAHAQWRLDTGNHPLDVSKIPDFQRWIVPGPLMAVARDRVTIAGP